MKRRLPPLNALRAFEATARHLSVTRAAEELRVTPAAISHQLKGLEDDLGIALFRRRGRSLVLTEAGQLAVPDLREGFENLAAGVALWRRHDGEGGLAVGTSPSFAARWLVPRLDRFHARHPDIEIRIDATDRLVDFARDGIDLAIRYGVGDYRGLHSVPMLTEAVFPVCCPRLLDDPYPLREPDDLRHYTLLHSEWTVCPDDWPDWRMWLVAAGAKAVDSSLGPKFSQMTLALEAAIAGQGVALGSTALVAADLAKGRLARPFALSVAPRFGVYLVMPKANAQRRHVAAFADWVLAEARGRVASDGET